MSMMQVPCLILDLSKKMSSQIKQAPSLSMLHMPCLIISGFPKSQTPVEILHVLARVRVHLVPVLFSCS